MHAISLSAMLLWYVQSRKDSKDQESIQSSITPVPGYQMGKYQNHNKHHKQEPRSQHFPFRWPQGSNEQRRKHDKLKTLITQMIHKRSTAMERSVKYFMGGPKPASQHANLILKPVLVLIISAWTHQCYIWARMIKFWTLERPRQTVKTLKNTYSWCFCKSSLIKGLLCSLFCWVLSL